MAFLYKLMLFLYRSASVQSRKVIKVALELTRRVLTLLGDPSYSIDIHGKKIHLPVSHKLPIYITDFPLYDTLPTRIANFLRTRDRDLIMVDVGANIGDTIVACKSGNRYDRFLAVEANPEFIPYLRKNTETLENVLLADVFCYSGEEKQAQVSIQSVGGTARVTEVKHGLPIIKKTLDEILNEHSSFQNINFLKLDTDGNDFDILRGASKSISTSQPIILMECDVFDNVGYVDDILAAFNYLEKAGYSTGIAYDNFGNYFCTFAVNKPKLFLDAIVYQLVSKFGYYDLLFLCKEHDEFVDDEKEFFSSYVAQKGFSSTLKKAFNIRFEQL